MLAIILTSILASHGIAAVPTPTKDAPSNVTLEDGRTARFTDARGSYVIMTAPR